MRISGKRDFRYGFQLAFTSFLSGYELNDDLLSISINEYLHKLGGLSPFPSSSWRRGAQRAGW